MPHPEPRHPDIDTVLHALRYAADREIGRRLVLAKRPDGFRIGYQVPDYGGAHWRSDGAGMATLPVAWLTVDWLGLPRPTLDEAARAAATFRTAVFDAGGPALQGQEPDRLLPVVVDLDAPAIPVIV
jgi:hypothetical protein